MSVFVKDGWLDIGRVEVWRGGLGFGLLPCQGFPARGAMSVCHAPFPHPALRCHGARQIGSPAVSVKREYPVPVDDSDQLWRRAGVMNGGGRGLR